MPTYTAYARYGELYLQFPFERDTPDLVAEGDLELAGLELAVSLAVPGQAITAFSHYPERDWLIFDEQLELVMVSELFFVEPGRTELLRENLEARGAEVLGRFRARRDQSDADMDGIVEEGTAFPHPRLRRPRRPRHDLDE